jgi:NADPH2:quinone reductase
MPEAVVMRRTGPPEVLVLEPVELAPLRPDEIRIRSIASAVNHSDLEIRAGTWPVLRAEPFPYVPGLEVVGEVMEKGSAVADFAVGDRVITMMQGLGGVHARRQGGYQELVTVAAAAAALLPSDLDPLDMAALGLAAVTALEGLRKLGPLAGRRIVVTGASGGVGSAALGLAHAQGAEVIAVVSNPARASYASACGAHAVMTAKHVVEGGLGEETIDGVLDNVAGELFRPCVAALRRDAVLSLVGAVGGSGALDPYELLRVTLTGYSSETLDGPRLREAIAAIGGWLRDGKLMPPKRTLLPLRDAAKAHALLEQRGVEGRVLLVPSAAAP